MSNEEDIQQQIQKMQEDAPNYLTEAYAGFKKRLCMDYLILSLNDQVNGGKFQHIQAALKMVPGNATIDEIDCKTTASTLLCWLVIPWLWRQTKTIFEVEANKFAFVIESHPKYGERTQIYGPGFHILGYDYKLEGIYSFDQKFKNNIIESSVGDLKIAKIEQGYIMHLSCGGQNIILGPGIHRITEPMKFCRYISLDSFFIHAGPEKWVTIPTGYDGISLNRGRIKILDGGKQHYLPHVSEKFIKMVPKTLQTDKIPTDIPTYVHNLNDGQVNYGRKQQAFDPTQYLETSTAEGSKVILDTMIQWVILDTKLASLTAMEILRVESIGNETTNEEAAISASSRNICNLRKTVLRVAKNHLTAMVGSISLSGQVSMSAQIKDKVPKQVQDAVILEDDEYSNEQLPLMDENLKKGKSKKKKNKGKLQSQQSLSSSSVIEGGAGNQNQKQSNFDILSSLQGQTTHLKDIINKDLAPIGCMAESVCIYKVTPSKEIQAELDKQTKARVDANTAIIQALSNQKSSKINIGIQNRNAKIKAESDRKVLLMEASSVSDAEKTKAKGQADAIMTVARARKEEAEQLQSSDIARELATTRVAGEAGQKIFSGKNNNFVFGQNPGDVLFNMFGKVAGNGRAIQ